MKSIKAFLNFLNWFQTLELTFLLARKEIWVERPYLVNFKKDSENMTPVLGRYLIVHSVAIRSFFIINQSKQH